MTTRILRPAEVWGHGGRLPVSKSAGWESYTLRDESDPYIPGTKIRRLKPVPLGGKAIGFVEAEVDAVKAALVALRDASPLKFRLINPRPRKRAAVPAKPKRSSKKKAA